MSQENYILSVYNTITGQFEDIEVSEAIYNGCRRSGWAVKRNDDRFRENEIPFSDLKGGSDDAYENFDEFRTEADNPEQLTIAKLTSQELQQAWNGLTDGERELLQGLIVKGKSEREVAREMGMPQRTLHDRKVNVFRKIKKMMDFEK